MARAALIITSCLTAIAASMAGTFLILRSRNKSVSGSSAKAGRSWYSSLKKIKLRNKHGMTVHFTPVGAAIQRLYVPDKNGVREDVVLGYDEAQTYAVADPTLYFGAIVGRVANRIKDAKFALNGKEYKLLANNGGAFGLHKRKWEYKQHNTDTHYVVEFSYTSPTGEEGYPGELHITAVYSLARDCNKLTLTITANASEATPVNIVQHSYFNLAGHNKGSILGHQLQLPEATHYVPVDEAGIPTGEIAPAAGTPFDFTQPHLVGERISQLPNGYDHAYVLGGMGPKAKDLTKAGVAFPSPKLAATVCHLSSGRTMDVLTTAPGVQLYTGNFLDGTAKGKGGAVYHKHGGLCLETQGLPNSVNEPSFPSIIIQPADTYRHDVVYSFYTK